MTCPELDQTLGVSYFAVTATGDRSSNEDAYGHARDGDVINFIVSDGVGGARGGMLASRTVVESSRKLPLSINPNDLRERFDATSNLIRHQQALSQENARMGATVAEIRIHCSQQQAVWGHWGDSRIYWFRGSELLETTNDHSVVQSFVNAGLLSASAALTHPKKNVLMGAFGVDCGVGYDVLPKSVYLAQGDAFLLCTDGFWNLVSEKTMLELLEKAVSVESWIKSMVQVIVNSDIENKDNYTAVGVWITSAEEKTVQFF